MPCRISKRSSCGNGRVKRRALRRAVCREMAISPRYGGEEGEEVKELGEAAKGAAGPLALLCVLPSSAESPGLCFSADLIPRLRRIPLAGKESTSVGPRLPRKAWLRRAMAASPSKQMVTSYAGSRRVCCTRRRKPSSGLTATGTRRWRLTTMYARGGYLAESVLPFSWDAGGAGRAA